MYLEYLTIIFVIFLMYLVFKYVYIDSIKDMENFDTYRNHDEFAETYYKNNDPKIFNNGAESNAKKDLYAKYLWNQKNKNGLKLYDHYYEKLNTENYINNDNKINYNGYTMPKEDPFIIFNSQKISLNQGIF